MAERLHMHLTESFPWNKFCSKLSVSVVNVPVRPLFVFLLRIFGSKDVFDFL